MRKETKKIKKIDEVYFNMNGHVSFVLLQGKRDLNNLDCNWRKHLQQCKRDGYFVGKPVKTNINEYGNKKRRLTYKDGSCIEYGYRSFFKRYNRKEGDSEFEKKFVVSLVTVKSDVISNEGENEMATKKKVVPPVPTKKKQAKATTKKKQAKAATKKKQAKATTKKKQAKATTKKKQAKATTKKKTTDKKTKVTKVTGKKGKVNDPKELGVQLPKGAKMSAQKVADKFGRFYRRGLPDRIACLELLLGGGKLNDLAKRLSKMDFPYREKGQRKEDDVHSLTYCRQKLWKMAKYIHGNGLAKVDVKGDGDNPKVQIIG
ncbi:MAG: hypothetical protein GF317_04945 [Candidatus Lokiarchaeota archaeon]|nr:hypothetical protein [Candidatus Lokiarchaeota archaeon]